MTPTIEEKLSILEQMIDDGQVDYMDIIRSLTTTNATLLKVCRMCFNQMDKGVIYLTQYEHKKLQQAINKAEGK